MQNDVLNHFEKFFGPAKLLYKQTDPSLPVDLVWFPATEQTGFHRIATLGLSEHEMKLERGSDDPRRQELIIYIPENVPIDLRDKKSQSTWACMLLFFTARGIIDHNIWLGASSIVHTEDTRHQAFSRYPFALVVPPLGEKPEFSPIKTRKGMVGFNVLMLITQKEADFLKHNGMAALMHKMLEQDTIYPVMVPFRHCTFYEHNDSKLAQSPKSAPQNAPVLRESARPAKPFELIPETIEKKPLSAQPQFQAGCAISTLLFAGTMVFLGSDSFQNHASPLSMLAAALAAGVFWIGFPFLFMRLRMSPKSNRAARGKPPRRPSTSAPGMEVIDRYLETWDEFAQGDNEKLEVLNAKKDAFADALSESLRNGDRRAPGRLVFLAVVTVAVPIPCASKIGKAFGDLVGDTVSKTKDEGEDVYFPGDIYFWWQKNKSKYEPYPLYEEWAERDFAKQTVIPTYERLWKKDQTEHGT